MPDDLTDLAGKTWPSEFYNTPDLGGFMDFVALQHLMLRDPDERAEGSEST